MYQLALFAVVGFGISLVLALYVFRGKNRGGVLACAVAFVLAEVAGLIGLVASAGIIRRALGHFGIGSWGFGLAGLFGIAAMAILGLAILCVAHLRRKALARADGETSTSA